MRFFYICPFTNFSRDFSMHFFYICPFANFSRDFSMHFFYICPSGNFHRDFLAYFFSICPQNTKKRTRKRNVPTQKHSLFHYVFIFPVLSVHCCPHPPHDRPHYGFADPFSNHHATPAANTTTATTTTIMTFSNMKFSS